MKLVLSVVILSYGHAVTTVHNLSYKLCKTNKEIVKYITKKKVTQFFVSKLSQV